MNTPSISDSLKSESPQPAQDSFEVLLDRMEALMRQLPSALQGDFPMEGLRSAVPNVQAESRLVLAQFLDGLEKKVSDYAALARQARKWKQAVEELRSLRQGIKTGFMKYTGLMERKLRNERERQMLEQAKAENERERKDIASAKMENQSSGGRRVTKEKAEAQSSMQARMAKNEKDQQNLEKQKEKNDNERRAIGEELRNSRDPVEINEKRDQQAIYIEIDLANEGSKELLDACAVTILTMVEEMTSRIRSALDRHASAEARTALEDNMTRLYINDGGCDQADIQYKEQAGHILSASVLPWERTRYEEILERVNIHPLNYEIDTVEKKMTPEVARTIVMLKQIDQNASDIMVPFTSIIADLSEFLRRAHKKSGKRMDSDLIRTLPDLMLQAEGAQRSCNRWTERIYTNSDTALEQVCALADLIRYHQQWLQGLPQTDYLPCAAYAYCIRQYCKRIEEMIQGDPQIMRDVQAYIESQPTEQLCKEPDAAAETPQKKARGITVGLAGDKDERDMAALNKPNQKRRGIRVAPAAFRDTVPDMSGPVRVPTSTSEPVIMPMLLQQKNTQTQVAQDPPQVAIPKENEK